MKVAVIGLGYVGLGTSVGAASAGHKVWGIDINLNVVSGLARGISHVEGITSESIELIQDQGLFSVGSDFSVLSEVDIAVIAVPTPLDDSGVPDLTFLRSAVASLIKHVPKGCLIINESTSLIGTLNREIAGPLKASKVEDLEFAVSPERIDPGNSRFGVGNTPRLVGGLSEASLQRAYEFYSSFCQTVIKVSKAEVAEAAKLLENSFRFVNIGFIQEFTKLMNSLEIPVEEVIGAASTKPFGFMPFFPSAGVGGHCIPVDPHYLQLNAKELEAPLDFIELAEKTNASMPEYVVSLLERHYGDLREKKTLVIGVSYKPNIADTRESPSRKVIELLRDKGSDVKWHDPLVFEYMGENSVDISDNFDLALVLTEHSNLNLEKLSSKPVYSLLASSSNKKIIPLFQPEIKPHHS